MLSLKNTNETGLAFIKTSKGIVPLKAGEIKEFEKSIIRAEHFPSGVTIIDKEEVLEPVASTIKAPVNELDIIPSNNTNEPEEKLVEDGIEGEIKEGSEEGEIIEGEIKESSESSLNETEIQDIKNKIETYEQMLKTTRSKTTKQQLLNEIQNLERQLPKEVHEEN